MSSTAPWISLTTTALPAICETVAEAPEMYACNGLVVCIHAFSMFLRAHREEPEKWCIAKEKLAGVQFGDGGTKVAAIRDRLLGMAVPDSKYPDELDDLFWLGEQAIRGKTVSDFTAPLRCLPAKRLYWLIVRPNEPWRVLWLVRLYLDLPFVLPIASTTGEPGLKLRWMVGQVLEVFYDTSIAQHILTLHYSRRDMVDTLTIAGHRKLALVPRMESGKFALDLLDLERGVWVPMPLDGSEFAISIPNGYMYRGSIGNIYHHYVRNVLVADTGKLSGGKHQ